MVEKIVVVSGITSRFAGVPANFLCDLGSILRFGTGGQSRGQRRTPAILPIRVRKRDRSRSCARPPQTPSRRYPGRPGRGSLACTAAAALLQLDGTLITVALPSVAHGLSVQGSSTSAVLSAYFAAYALMLIPGGELVDRYGARRLALIGLALFAVGALAGALSQSFGELIGSRVIQGAGAGLVSPAALAGAVSGFPAERRGAALGIWGASAGMSNLIGPLLGGLLTVAFGWRADWWALVPLAAAAAIGVARLVPRVLHAPSPLRGRRAPVRSSTGSSSPRR